MGANTNLLSCDSCGHVFEAEDDPDGPFVQRHPCPQCGADCKSVSF